METIKIYADKPIPALKEAYACIGYFDGVHRGHRKLIEKVVALSKKHHVHAACICFDIDPWIVMQKSKDNNQITPFALRMDKLAKAGIEICYLLHFDETMRQLQVDAFIQKILEKLNLKGLICGKDFHFAYQGKGTIKELAKMSFPLYIVEEVVYQGKKISSSTIEVLLKAGKVEEANLQLGYSYTLYGKVIHGNNVGKKVLGFPTANLALDDAYVIVKEGVYAGYVIWKEQVYQAMINVGHNPTMNPQQNLSIEAHIIDFNDIIYDEKISISFTSYLRKERHFSDIEALITQLKKDIDLVKNNKG